MSPDVGGLTSSDDDDDSLPQRFFRRPCGNAAAAISALVFAYPWVCSGLWEVGHCYMKEDLKEDWFQNFDNEIYPLSEGRLDPDAASLRRLSVYATRVLLLINQLALC